MKKTVLMLLLTGFSTVLMAGPVTPEKALQVAEKVLSAQPVTKAASGLRIVWDGESAATKAEGEAPAFYVVDRDGGGFVIVAGNDNVRPVLALSYTNHFRVENMPCNVSAWMERIKRYSRGTLEAAPEVRAQWEAFAETKGVKLPEAGVTGVYFPNNTPTVEWGQEEPANLLMPTIPREEGRAVCGCVPLAVAEIMTWFGRPEKGNGTVPGYTSNRTSIPAHELTTIYDWAGLQSLNTPSLFVSQCKDGDTTALAWNAAQLLYDVGTLLQVSYSYDGTSGSEDVILERLCGPMGYSKNTTIRNLNTGYPAWKWDQMLVEQVSRHPVYYGGNDPYAGGGHAYVLDGYGQYNGSTVFHFNFGWYGYCNGYYSSDYQAPSDARKPNTDFGEYHYVVALFDFVPDVSGTSSYVYELSYAGQGISASVSGNTISVKGDDLINTGNVAFSGDLSLFYVDKDGVRGTQPLVSKDWNNVDLLLGYSSYTFPFSAGSISGGLALGDRFAFYYKPNGEQEYRQVRGLSSSSSVEEAPVFPAAFIKTEASYSRNDYFYFRLINHDYTYDDAVWTIRDKDGVVTTCSQSQERFQFTKSGKYTIKVKPKDGGETIVTVINVN